MDSIKNIGPNQFAATERVDKLKPKTISSEKPSSVGGAESKNFADLLSERLVESPKAHSLGELKFSAHAKTRLLSRGIELGPQDMLKLSEAVQRAQEKGSRDSLILSDKGAFIVSVKNNTVITAVDKESIKENVFTNIDSTIMI